MTEIDMRYEELRRQPHIMLVNTSADDMRASLRCARNRGGESLDTLTQARDLAASMGKRTHLKLIEAEIRWVGKQANSPADRTAASAGTVRPDVGREIAQ